MAQIPLGEFADKIIAIMPAMIKGFTRRQADELYKGKITLPQLLTLDFIHRESEGKMTEVARFLKVTTAATTGIVARLVKNGWVLRVFDPGDRRIIKIRLTAKGEQLLKKINRERRNMIMHIFGKVSQAERQEYLKILTHIHEILTQENES